MLPLYKETLQLMLQTPQLHGVLACMQPVHAVTDLLCGLV